MLNRQQRIQSYEDLAAIRPTPKPRSIADLAKACRHLPPSSEERFEKINNKTHAVRLVQSEVEKFANESGIVVESLVEGTSTPPLNPESHFKYSGTWGGSYQGFCERIEMGEPVSVLTIVETATVIGYALVEHNGDETEIKIIDVERVSQRSNGFHSSFSVEGKEFSVGAAHVLVASIITQFGERRLHTDATHPTSRYVFKSLGFDRYADHNPCLLENRPS